jgi:hypothetical protein
VGKKSLELPILKKVPLSKKKDNGTFLWQENLKTETASILSGIKTAMENIYVIPA